MIDAQQVEIRDYSSSYAMAQGVATMTSDSFWGVKSVSVTPERYLRVVFVRRERQHLQAGEPQRRQFPSVA